MRQSILHWGKTRDSGQHPSQLYRRAAWRVPAVNGRGKEIGHPRPLFRCVAFSFSLPFSPKRYLLRRRKIRAWTSRRPNWRNPYPTDGFQPYWTLSNWGSQNVTKGRDYKRGTGDEEDLHQLDPLYLADKGIDFQGGKEWISWIIYRKAIWTLIKVQ